jgi:hypothetical protein
MAAKAIPGVGLWRHVAMRPGDAGSDPVLALAQALLTGCAVCGCLLQAGQCRSGLAIAAEKHGRVRYIVDGQPAERRTFEPEFLAGSAKYTRLEEFDRKVEADLTRLIERRIQAQRSGLAIAAEKHGRVRYIVDGQPAERRTFEPDRGGTVLLGAVLGLNATFDALEGFWSKYFENQGLFLAGSAKYTRLEEFDRKVEADLTRLIERRIGQ